MVNEDTDGDRAALKREIKRLQEELAAARRAHFQATAPSAASDGPAAVTGVAEPQGGTPARLAATAEAMVAAASPSAGEVSRGANICL